MAGFEGVDPPTVTLRPPTGATTTIPPDDLRTARTIVTGVAGAGKTMLLRYLHTTNQQGPVPVPLLVDNANPPETMAAIDAAAGQAIAEVGRRARRSDVERVLDTGEVLLLCDDIDVLSANRPDAADAIAAWLTRHPSCPATLTARTEHWPDTLVLACPTVGRIDPLTAIDAASMIRWWADRHGTEPPLTTLASLRATPGLRVAATNPGLLILTLDAYATATEPPAGIADLCRQIVHHTLSADSRNLAGTWERREPIARKGTDEPPAQATLAHPTLAAFLAATSLTGPPSPLDTDQDVLVMWCALAPVDLSEMVTAIGDKALAASCAAVARHLDPTLASRAAAAALAHQPAAPRTVQALAAIASRPDEAGRSLTKTLRLALGTNRGPAAARVLMSGGDADAVEAVLDDFAERGARAPHLPDLSPTALETLTARASAGDPAAAAFLGHNGTADAATALVRALSGSSAQAAWQLAALLHRPHVRAVLARIDSDIPATLPNWTPAETMYHALGGTWSAVASLAGRIGCLLRAADTQPRDLPGPIDPVLGLGLCLVEDPGIPVSVPVMLPLNKQAQRVIKRINYWGRHVPTQHHTAPTGQSQYFHDGNVVVDTDLLAGLLIHEPAPTTARDLATLAEAVLASATWTPNAAAAAALRHLPTDAKRLAIGLLLQRQTFMPDEWASLLQGPMDASGAAAQLARFLRAVAGRPHRAHPRDGETPPSMSFVDRSLWTYRWPRDQR
jgi:hypothetical protein